MEARVVVFLNGKQELCVPIEESGAGIGRETGNEVQLSMPEVSKRHAFLQKTAKGWRVLDTNSRNGLFVNGGKVHEAILKDGDKLAIGPYTLVFEFTKGAEPYKPILEIDVTDNAVQQTIPRRRSNI